MQTMRVLLSALCVMMVLGCQSPTKIAAADHTPAVGDSVAQARGHVASADAATERAKPHADNTGKEFLDAAHDEHGKADAKLGEAQVALAQVRADQAAKAAEVVRQKTLLDAYHDRWTGDKFQRVLTRIIIGIVTAIGMALVAFAVAPWLGGLLGAATSGLGHAALTVGTVGGNLITGMVNWIAALFHPKSAVPPNSTPSSGC